MATYKYDSKTKFVLPSGFEYLVEKDDDGNDIKRIVADKYYDDEGELSYHFMAGINEMEVNYENESATLSFKDIAQDMIDGTGRKGGRFYVIPGSPQCMFMTIPMPLSIFGVMIKSFALVLIFQEDRHNLIQIVSSSVFNDDEPKENTKIYENIMKLAKSVRIDGEKLPLDELTAKKLQKALELTFNEDDETIDVSPKINLEINDGEEIVTYELTKDGLNEVETEKDVYFKTSDIPVKKGNKKSKKKKAVEEDTRILPVDTLRLSDHYEQPFLNKYGKDIKRVVIPDHCASYSVNYILLDKCPNIEEFIIGKDSAYTFVDGVLYSQSSDKRSIVYITKGVKKLHIEADVDNISYWHGIDSITVDKANSTFVVQDDMLLSRRKNSLYLVTSNARVVNIPEGVTSIHAKAFEYCDKLEKVVFPSSYEWKGWYSSSSGPIFYVSDAMRNANIVVNGNMARYENKMVLKYPDTHPDVVLYLGDPDQCYIPAKLTSTFGFSSAFYNVKNFTVDANNTMLSSSDGVVLDKEGKTLKFYPGGRDYFSIPKSVKTIESHSVSYCNKLKEVVIPENVDSVGMMAFSNCENLKKVTKTNPKADINKDAFFGCELDSDKKDEETLDEHALMRELDKEINAIKEAAIPKEEKKKERLAKSKNTPKKEFKYDDHVSFNLPEDFIIAQDTDKDGNKNTEFLWGEYFNDNDNETQYKFSALLGEMTANESKYGKTPDAKVLMDLFVDNMPKGYVSRSYTDFANLPCAFISAEDPTEVPFGIFGNIVLENYKIYLGLVSDNKVIYLVADGYKDEKNDENVEKEDLLYEKILEIAEGISIDGEKINLKGLDDEKLRKEIEPLFADSESTFNLGLGGSDEAEEKLPEVRFDENNNRRVIVDNKWSFDLPKGIDLRFNSEHVDIMGDNKTANYVVEGVEHNGRFFFDFELYQRPEFGMETDLDVLGCRYDNDVTAGNAKQNILVDGDDLFVDIVHKPIFFFRSMVILRVRGDELRPWDFQIGLSETDQDMISRWDEVKDKLKELAESIKLIDSVKKSTKKKAKTEDTGSDPDFIVTNGVLRKYIGHSDNIVIPDGVKEIPDSTFSGFSNLKTVVIPEGVKKIGRRSFENCTKLENISLPESLEEIGGYAFADCHKLKEVYLSEKLKMIGDSAFTECFAMKDVKIPKKIKEIEAFAFKNCDTFTHIVVPDGVTKIGFCAFLGCDNLEYLYIPKSVKEFEINFMNQLPLGDCPKLTVYTPAGSDAQKFAEEHDIPYKNADKGVITAKNDKTIIESVKTGETKSSGAKVKKTAKRDEAVRNVKFAVADVIEKNIKLKNGDASKKYVARFVPVSEFLEDGAVYNVYSNYVLSYEVDNKKEISDALNKYLDIFNDEEKYDIKYGCLNNTTPLHALRSFAWTSAETFNKRDRDHLDPNITTEMLLDLADFIYDRDFANYKVIKSDSLRFGYPIIPKQEINCWYPLEYSDFDFRYKFKNGYFSLAHYNGIYYPLRSVIRMLKEMITFMDVFFEACKDDSIDENVAYASRTILEGWCYYASAIKSPFALIASDDLKTDKTPEEIIKETDVESELKKIETQDGITTYDNIIFNINRDIIGNEFVIPEGITRIFEEGIIRIIGAYPVKNKMMRMIYPSTFTGTVYYLSNTKELIINSNVDVLDVKMASSDAYKDGSDLEKLEINGNVRRIERQNFWSKKLKQIKLSDTIESIGFNLYSKELTSVRLPDNLKELEKGVFQFCNLKTVTIPENLEVIGENAFGFDVSGIRFEAYKDSVGYETIKKYLASKNARNNITLLDPIWMEKALSFSSKISAEYSSSLQAYDIKERIMDIINSTLANNENYTKGRKKIISNIYIDQLDIVKKTVEECETIEELKSKLPSLLAEDIPKVKREKEIKKTKNLITEKKLQISRLEKEISEKEEKIKNYEKEIDENQQMLSSKESSLGYDLGNKKFQLTTNLNGQKAVIFKLEEKVKEKEIEIENTSKELENAGFFKFSLKKELNAKIDSLNSEIAKIKENLESESTKLDEITKDYSELVEKPSAELESLKSKVSNLIFTKRQISASIDSTKKSIENYKEEILRLEERLNKM